MWGSWRHSIFNLRLAVGSAIAPKTAKNNTSKPDNQKYSKNKNKKLKKDAKEMDGVGIEPTTSRMQSERYYH
jgi:hypothetical protein